MQVLLAVLFIQGFIVSILAAPVAETSLDKPVITRQLVTRPVTHHHWIPCKLDPRDPACKPISNVKTQVRKPLNNVKTQAPKPLSNVKTQDPKPIVHDNAGSDDQNLSTELLQTPTQPANSKDSFEKVAAPVSTAVKPITSESLSVTDQTFLNLHNQYRAKHRNTPALVWDDQLAKTAMNHAKQCIFKHITPNPYAENIAMAQPDIAEALREWYDEYKLFDFNNQQWQHATGHFINMAQTSVKKLGCAVVSCSLRTINQSGMGNNYVCEYGGGNSNDSPLVQPFKSN